MIVVRTLSSNMLFALFNIHVHFYSLILRLYFPLIYTSISRTSKCLFSYFVFTFLLKDISMKDNEK